MPRLATALHALYAQTDHRARIAHDPVQFVHRYDQPVDQAWAGFLAVTFAYGRVDLFVPVLHRLFDALDAWGGPDAAIATFTVERAPALAQVAYRFQRPDDVVWLLQTLRRIREHHGGLEALFAGSGPLRDRLTRAVATMRDHALAVRPGAPKLSYGMGYSLPSPHTGSACKRWNLYLRWMVRPTTEGVDVGIWNVLTPADLVMPVDVHIARVARFAGLTTRRDASWRTATAITAALADLDPDDPVRFDFALCHLGISGACRGHRVRAVCVPCPLDPVCVAPKGP